VVRANAGPGYVRGIFRVVDGVVTPVATTSHHCPGGDGELHEFRQPLDFERGSGLFAAFRLIDGDLCDGEWKPEPGRRQT
jgi:hypothetical protein